MKNLTSTNNHDNNQKATARERLWSSIPLDLLGIVLSYLYAGDEVNFRLVCKIWQSISRIPRSFSSPFDDVNSPTPWLCSILPARNNMGICKFFHPIYNEADFYEVSPEISDCHICFSGYGWLLLRKDLKKAFFFHLSTKKRIGDLPDLPDRIILMSFTSPPNYPLDSPPDCIVGIDSLLLGVYTYKSGWTGWKTYVVEEDMPFQIFSIDQCSPICHNGRFYCMDPKGNLIEIDASNDIQRSSITYSRVDFHSHCREVVLQTFMLVKEEELLVVVFTKNDLLYVYKWDNEEKELVPVKSLEDYMLFISCVGSFSEKAIVRGTGNKIFSPTVFYRNDKYAFYSLATKKYHSFSNSHVSHPTSFKISHLCNSFWFRV